MHNHLIKVPTLTKLNGWFRSLHVLANIIGQDMKWSFILLRRRRILLAIRTKWIKICLMLLIGIAIYFVTINDAPLYHQTIAEVVSEQTGKPKRQTDQFDNHDQLQSQTMTLRILNGSKQGTLTSVKNSFSQSNAQDLRYHVGQQLLIHLRQSHAKYQAEIIDVKRDASVVLTLWLMMCCLFIVLGTYGIRSLLSLTLNTLFFFVAIQFDILMDADSALALFAGVALVFLALTSGMLFGWHKKAAVVMLSSASGLLIAFVIEIFVLHLTDGAGLKFEMMNFVTQSRMPLYLSASLLGALGAVVDIAGDVSVSLAALKRTNKEMSTKALFKAGCRLNRSIVGPLTNVLSLIFTTSTLPTMILFLRNGNSIGYSITMIMSLGIFQTLASGIGIAVTGPLTSLFASYALTKEGGPSWDRSH